MADTPYYSGRRSGRAHEAAAAHFGRAQAAMPDVPLWTRASGSSSSPRTSTAGTDESGTHLGPGGEEFQDANRRLVAHSLRRNHGAATAGDAPPASLTSGSLGGRSSASRSIGSRSIMRSPVIRHSSDAADGGDLGEDVGHPHAPTPHSARSAPSLPHPAPSARTPAARTPSALSSRPPTAEGGISRSPTTGGGGDLPPVRRLSGRVPTLVYSAPAPNPEPQHQATQQPTDGAVDGRGCPARGRPEPEPIEASPDHEDRGPPSFRSMSSGLTRSAGHRYTRDVDKKTAAERAASSEKPSSRSPSYNPFTEEEEGWLELVRNRQLRAKKMLENGGYSGVQPDEAAVTAPASLALSRTSAPSMRYAIAPAGGMSMLRPVTSNALNHTAPMEAGAPPRQLVPLRDAWKESRSMSRRWGLPPPPVPTMQGQPHPFGNLPAAPPRRPPRGSSLHLQVPEGWTQLQSAGVAAADWRAGAPTRRRESQGDGKGGDGGAGEAAGHAATGGPGGEGATAPGGERRRAPTLRFDFTSPAAASAFPETWGAWHPATAPAAGSTATAPTPGSLRSPSRLIWKAPAEDLEPGVGPGRLPVIAEPPSSSQLSDRPASESMPDLTPLSPFSKPTAAPAPVADAAVPQPSGPPPGWYRPVPHAKGSRLERISPSEDSVGASPQPSPGAERPPPAAARHTFDGARRTPTSPGRDTAAGLGVEPLSADEGGGAPVAGKRSGKKTSKKPPLPPWALPDLALPSPGQSSIGTPSDVAATTTAPAALQSPWQALGGLATTGGAGSSAGSSPAHAAEFGSPDQHRLATTAPMAPGGLSGSGGSGLLPQLSSNPTHTMRRMASARRAGAAGYSRLASTRLSPHNSLLATSRLGATITRRGSTRRAAPARPGLAVGLALAVDEAYCAQGQWTTSGWAPMNPGQLEVYIPSGLQQILPDDLIKVRELGRGQFGLVWLALWCGVEVALKELHSAKLTDQQQQEVFLEAERLAGMRHPCVIAFYGIVTTSPDAYGTVVEYVCMGSLSSALRKVGKRQGDLPMHTKAHIALQAARGMEYLHFQGVVHFDLKCDNLLCDLRDLAKPIVKIGDMGLSQLTQGESAIRGKMQGTLPWMAPELFVGGGMSARFPSMRRNPTALRGAAGGRTAAVVDSIEDDTTGVMNEERPPWLETNAPWPEPGALAADTGRDMAFSEDDEFVTNKVDVYSFAVCLWEIWTMGGTPYSEVPPSQLKTKLMMQASHDLRPAIPHGCHPDWVQLMQDCWASRPTDRPTFTEIARRLTAMAQLPQLPPA